MTVLPIFLTLCLIIAQVQSAQEKGWTFKDCDYWCNDYPTCCGDNQSPIKINSKEVHQIPLSPVHFTSGYFAPLKGELINTGYSVQFRPSANGTKMTFKGGPFYDDFQFDYMELFWGKSDDNRAMHKIDNQDFAGELHLIHHKVDLSLEEAKREQDGFATLAFPLKEGDNKSPYPTSKTFYKALDNIKKTGQSKTVKMSMADLFLAAGPVNDYYSYTGSQVMPPCLEVVTWMVFHPLELSEDMFDRLRELKDINGKEMHHQYRKMQDLGERDVTHNK